MFHNDYHSCWAHYKVTANFSEILQEHARLNSDILEIILPQTNKLV